MAVATRGTPLMQDEAQATIIWWLTRILAGVCVIGAAGWGVVIWRYTRPAQAPYGFLVDSATGERVAQAEAMTQAASVPEATVRENIRQFVREAFTVTTDWPETLGLERQAFAVTGQGEPHDSLAAFYLSNSPLDLSQEGWREVPLDGITVLELGNEGHYEVHFRTVWHKKMESDPKGTTTQWRGSLVTGFTAPTPGNPFGFALKYFDFAKETE